MARPASYSVIFGTTSLWLTGTYAFDGTGNVKAIGTSSFCDGFDSGLGVSREPIARSSRGPGGRPRCDRPLTGKEKKWLQEAGWTLPDAG